MLPTWLKTARDILTRLNTYSTAQNPSGQTWPEVQIDTAKVPDASKDFMTLDKFNSVEYDAQHLWEMKIAGAPYPFNDWFPAQSVEENIRGVSVSSMSFGIDEVNTLNSYNALTMRVEILDNNVAILERWLKAWSKAIALDPKTHKPYIGFRYLEDILATMTITKYNWQKKKISKTEYYVLPTGNISLGRQNDPAVKVLNTNFAVFGSKELPVQ